MDDKLKDKPTIKLETDFSISDETKELVKRAEKVYWNNFNGDAWFGRCIFLSWYCERGTCDFCFRSVQKHKIKHPKKARRSISSVLAEAMMIRGFGWRIEFLTGGYGIAEDDELVEIVKKTSEVLGEPIWLNLGEIGVKMLNRFNPYTKGIISSIETFEPKLHKKVCPDKPIKPYEDMIVESKKLGFKQGITIIIGLGEKKEDFSYIENFLKKYQIGRITLYALRPVKGTPYTSGPTTDELCWWIAKTRIAFPKIEIIVGTARYRIKEIKDIFLSGANAVTKLPATNIFNTKDGLEVERQVKLAKRNFLSSFHSKDVYNHADWQGMLKTLPKEEQVIVMNNLKLYLDSMTSRFKTIDEEI